MTGFALRSKLSSMCIILDVTGGAVHRRAFEDTILMTALASYRGM
jgi:hypothetical protein